MKTNVIIKALGVKHKLPNWSDVREGNYVVVNCNNESIPCIVINIDLDKFEVFSLNGSFWWHNFNRNDLPPLLKILDEVTITY